MIWGAVGPLGGGKTLTQVRLATESARRSGCLLASNIKLTPPDGLPFVQLPMSADWPDRLLDLVLAVSLGLYPDPRPGMDGKPVSGVIFVLDEAGLMLNSRAWRDMPTELIFMMSQGRKIRADIYWTAQFEDMVDAILRQITVEIRHCSTWPRIGIRGRQKGQRPWVVRVKRYRPGTVDTLDKCLGTNWMRYRREWEGWYDTDELVFPPKLAERARQLIANGPVGLVAVGGGPETPDQEQ